MALPLPDHDTNRPIAVDVSSKILYKLDTATKDTLKASLAQEWISELDQSIQQTKLCIHERMQSELPKFQRQFEKSKNVQSRYDTLSTQVDEIHNILLNPKTGIHPTLVETLTRYSALAQESSNAEHIYRAFLNLQDCRNAYASLSSSVQVGQLPEAIKIIGHLENVVAEMPDFLKQTQVVEDLNQRLSSSKARIQDQLSDAFSRSITLSTTEILIRPQVQVRLSETILQFPAILCALSSSSLTNHLSIFRRDFMAHFVDHVLQQPHSISLLASPHEFKLSMFPVASHNEDLSKRLDNLSTILNFLFDYFFPHLPQPAEFTRSLSKPLTNSILNHFLVPMLPSSFGLLPSFLKLLKRAVSFEEEDIGRLLQSERNEGSIKAWSHGISGHYERRRRIDVLEQTRAEILAPEDLRDTFQVFEVDFEVSLSTVIPTSAETNDEDAWGFDDPSSSNPAENEWNFEDDPSPSDGLGDVANVWGLDEPTDLNHSGNIADTWHLDGVRDVKPESTTAKNGDERNAGRSEADCFDPEDAWGWNDNVDVLVDETIADNAWDDPWSDSTKSMDVETAITPSVVQTANVISQKSATRLSKSRNQVNGHSSLSNSQHPASPPFSTQLHSTLISSLSTKSETQRKPSAPIKHPSDVVVPNEFYLVPKRTKFIMKMVETVIDESKLFYASNLFADKKGMDPPAGTILSQSASSILDLYQALYPIKRAKELEDPSKALLFSNSYFYMTGAIQRIEDTLYGQSALKERLAECRHHFSILSDSWFEETIERQQQVIDKILSGAQGFTDTSDQDRYDECEAAVNSVLQNIKRLAQHLKEVLTKSKYYTAIGSVSNAALSRILQDILALPDIPEVESHRLSELCRILKALEGLFSEDPEEPSFVAAYVPHWLKFSYLSEVMEASLADITYLFEQGALVDFQVDELVKLVRALFSDTSLRTNTISKLLSGQPKHLL